MHQQAYNNSIQVLLQAATSKGFVAAVQEHDNYKRVWTRDGVVCSLAALLSGNEQLIQTAEATLHTIFQHQHADGFMPSNVHPESGKVSYGGAVGRTDNPLWAVIGLCHYTLSTGNTSLLQEYRPQVEKCFAVLNAWEYNGKHLLYVPQSGDWADEYIQHGYILFEQLLRVWALQLAGGLYNNPSWKEKAECIREVIQNNYWISDNNTPYLSHLFLKQAEAFDGYWLMGFNPSRVYAYFDLQANALSLLLQMGSTGQNHTLINRMEQLFFQQSNHMLPSFYPAITSQDDDMKELLNNYAYQFRNKPHQFHNGGLWPVWNGWMSMALSQTGYNTRAVQIAQAIHAANSQQQNNFNECFDGISNQPCGVSLCAWSAAGAIIAEQGLQGNFFITNC